MTTSERSDDDAARALHPKGRAGAPQTSGLARVYARAPCHPMSRLGTHVQHEFWLQNEGSTSLCNNLPLREH